MHTTTAPAGVFAGQKGFHLQAWAHLQLRGGPLSIVLLCRPRVKGRFVKQSDFDDLHLGDVKEEDAEVMPR